MATDQKDVAFEVEYAKARDMYDYPFEKAEAALTQQYGSEQAAKQDILNTIRNNPDKIGYKTSYRVATSPAVQMIKSAPQKLRDVGIPVPEPYAGDVAGVVPHVVRQLSDTNLPLTPWGMSEKAGEVIDAIPYANAPLVDEKRIGQIADVASYVNPIGYVAKITGNQKIKDVAGAMNEWVGEQAVGLATPKNLAIGAAMMTPAAPVAAALIAPQLLKGAVSGAGKSYDAYTAGDVVGMAKGVLDVGAAALMAKGLMKAGAESGVTKRLQAEQAARLEADRVASDVAQKRAFDADKRVAELSNRRGAESAEAERSVLDQMLRDDPRSVLSDNGLTELAVKHGLIDAETGAIVLRGGKPIELAAPMSPQEPIPLGPSRLLESADVADATIAGKYRGRTYPQEVEQPVDISAIQDQIGAGTVRRVLEDQSRSVVTPEEAALRPATEPVRVVADMSTAQLLKEAGLGQRGSVVGENLTDAQLKFREMVRAELARRGAQAIDVATKGAMAAQEAGKKPADVMDVVPRPRTIEAPSSIVASELAGVGRGSPAPSIMAAKDINVGNVGEAISKKRGDKAIGGSLLYDVPRALEHMEAQPGAVGAIGKELVIAKNDAMRGHAMLQDSEMAQLSKAMDDLGVKSTRQKKLWGRLVQSYGEGELSAEQIAKKYGSDMLSKVQAGEQYFRAKYDELLENINAKRAEHGLNPISKTENYFRWVQEQDLSDIQGLADVFGEVRISSPFKKPSKTMGEQSIAKSRGNIRPGKANAIKGYLDYLPQYANEMFNHDLKAKVEGARSDLESLRGGDESLLAGTHNVLTDLSRRLSLEKNPIDKMIEKHLGTKGTVALNVMKKVATKLNYSMVNTASSIVNNTAVLPVLAAKAAPSSIVRGAVKLLSDMARGERSSDLGYFTKERYLDAAARKLQKGKISGKLSIKQAFEMYDEMLTDLTFNTFLDQGIRKGLSEKEAVRYADLETGKTVGARARLDRPMFYESTVGRILAPFTIEVNNLWNEMSNSISGKGNMTSRKVAGKFLKYSMAAYLANNIIENFTGTRPAFDPASALLDAYEIVGDKNKSSKKKAVAIAGRIGGEIIGAHPLGNLATSYFVDQNTRNAMFGRNDPGKFGSSTLARPIKQAWKVVSGDNTAEDAAKLALMFYSKGGQLRKTYEGAKSLVEGGFKVGKRFVPIENKGPVDVAKRLLFGPYPTSEMQEALKGSK